MPERVMTINIRRYLVTQPRTKRPRKAIRYIRERVAHYTKIDIENVKINQALNNLVFKYYSKRMVPVKVNVKIGTDTADVLPFAMKEQPKEAKEEKKGRPLISRKEAAPVVPPAHSGAKK